MVSVTALLQAVQKLRQKGNKNVPFRALRRKGFAFIVSRVSAHDVSTNSRWRPSALSHFYAIERR
jgi:hypothetical protein